MSSDTFIQGLSRVLNCSKVHVATAGLVTTWFAVHYVAADLPPTQRASLWVAFIGAVTVQLREIINAWTEEDVAQVAKSQSPAALPQPTPDGATATAAAGPIEQAVKTDSLQTIEMIGNGSANKAGQMNSTTRSTRMPPRTKFPLVLVGCSLVAMFAGTGCQTPPELVTYREGLHQVDEPLYQAHLLLMNDAVSANLRTDADRQVVQQGIAAARSLYQQSKATQAAGLGALPATGPAGE